MEEEEDEEEEEEEEDEEEEDSRRGREGERSRDSPSNDDCGLDVGGYSSEKSLSPPH